MVEKCFICGSASMDDDVPMGQANSSMDTLIPICQECTDLATETRLELEEQET